MHIKNLYKEKTVVSLEIFPPKSDSPIDTIFATIKELSKLEPDFISVTYGAGGSSQENTIFLTDMIKNQYNIEALAHLTCISSTKTQIEACLDNLKLKGINNILALRGDYPSDPNIAINSPRHYTHAADLINHITEHNSFCIGAACYPEGHIECRDLDKNIIHLKEKVECGVDFLITQLFYDNTQFYTFREKLQKQGINIPISAGIMPITNINQIKRIIEISGATLPEKYRKILEKYEANPIALKEAGIYYAIEQIIDLLTNDVKGIHLYTMNKPEIAIKILSNCTLFK